MNDDTINFLITDSFFAFNGQMLQRLIFDIHLYQVVVG